MTSPRTTGPAPGDYQLADFCQKLFVGAINGQHYASAWAALAVMFQASSVQLLMDLPAQLDEVTKGFPVGAFDAGVRHPALARALAASGADHGLVAEIRHVRDGVDALVMSRKVSSFTEGERAWMELVVGHIRAALDLGTQLASPLPTAGSAAHLARLFPTPCLLTDEAGRCIEWNDAFCRALAALSGSVRAGRVWFEDSFLQDSWRQALLEGHATATTQSLLANTPSGNQWKIHVVPFACVNRPGETVPRHLMFALVEKSAGAAAQTRTVPSSRPLTKAELEVLASLLLGQTAKVIARTRASSVNTVRSQITAILGKTGHRTQKELIASFSMSGFDGLVTIDNDEQPWRAP